MKNQLQIFEHEQFGKVRVVEINGEPWFVGRDVASILGYEKPQNALLKHVAGDDALKWGITDSLGRTQKTTIINESGLYALIMSSKLPQAKAFRRWVTAEILPSIRRHGIYATRDTLEKMIASPQFTEALLEALQEEHSKNCALELEVEVLERQNAGLEGQVGVLKKETRELRGTIGELENDVEILEGTVDIMGDTIVSLSPKAMFCDSVLDSGEALQVSIIAKDYGMSAAKFNILLRDLGIQYKVGKGGTWLLYQKYAGLGYTKTKTFFTPTGNCMVHTYWTHKGRKFLHDALALVGLHPQPGAAHTQRPSKYEEDTA